MGRPGAKRARRSRSEWLQLVARFRESGLSMSEFCRREGLSPKTFSWWKAKLTPTGSAATPSFVEWSMPASNPAKSDLAVGEMELSFPGGVRLRWRA